VWLGRGGGVFWGGEGRGAEKGRSCDAGELRQISGFSRSWGPWSTGRWRRSQEEKKKKEGYARAYEKVSGTTSIWAFKLRLSWRGKKKGLEKKGEPKEK